MKKVLAIMLLVGFTAFATESFASGKDHVPKVEQVSKQEVKDAVVAADFTNVEAYAIQHVDSYVSFVEAESSLPDQETKSGFTYSKKKTSNSHLIPRIRDKGRC